MCDKWPFAAIGYIYAATTLENLEIAYVRLYICSESLSSGILVNTRFFMAAVATREWRYCSQRYFLLGKVEQSLSKVAQSPPAYNLFAKAQCYSDVCETEIRPPGQMRTNYTFATTHPLKIWSFDCRECIFAANVGDVYAECPLAIEKSAPTLHPEIIAITTTPTEG